MCACWSPRRSRDEWLRRFLAEGPVTGLTVFPRRFLPLLAVCLLLAGLLAACSTNNVHHPEAGIHKIKHVIIIMQENRSFDSYFGTYPGAAGIPMKNGVPTVCVPDPKTHKCVRPYHGLS